MQKDVNPYLREFDGHCLSLVYGSPDTLFQFWRMARPGATHFLVQVSFSPEGIAIQGDCVLGENGSGVCTRHAKGVHWFASQLSRDYLCGKFLTKRWRPEVAEEDINTLIQELTKELGEQEAQGQSIALTRRQLTTARQFLDENNLKEMSPGSFSQLWASECPDIFNDDESIGYGFDPCEADLLCAIQERFRQLFLGRPRLGEDQNDKRA
jgi:hypothetical protein